MNRKASKVSAERQVDKVSIVKEVVMDGGFAAFEVGVAGNQIDSQRST